MLIGSCNHQLGSWQFVHVVDDKGVERKLALCKHCVKKLRKGTLVIDGVEYKCQQIPH
jgi:hypothetical protein